MREFKELLDERCLSEEPAFCTAACPFGLDVREFISKAERGSFRAAYRAYAGTVGFPAIVSAFCDAPCEKKCIRAKVDGAVRLSLLERSVLAQVKDRKPNSYYMPPKGKKIVIIGGGLSGLGCALKCCWQKYSVEIYEASDRLGGSLWEADPGGGFLEEIRNQFQFEKPEIHLNTKVTSLEELEFDACYIATGKGGDAFGLRLSGTGAFAADRKGVFLGGELTGRTRMEALADGLEAIYAIERYVKIGYMNQPAKEHGTRLKMKEELILPKQPAEAEGDLYNKEEAMQEAGRCLKCRCDACLKGCDLMNFYKKYPRRIEEEVEITIHPGTLSGDGTVATRLIATCNHCGRCAKVCPEGIDVGKFLLASHNIMRAKGAMPWVFHEFWLRDMEFAMGEASLVLKPRNEGVSGSTAAPDGREAGASAVSGRENSLPECGTAVKQVFFPGCRIGGTMPEIVKKLYAHLLKQEKGTAVWLSCCALPARWAGEEELHREKLAGLRKTWEALGKPVVITACESCLKSFRENLPEIPVKSVYPMLSEAGSGPEAGNGSADRRRQISVLLSGLQEAAAAGNAGCPDPSAGGGREEYKAEFSVFDPCAAREDPESGKAVRKLAEELGLPAQELPRHGEYASCCSFGGHTAISNPHYTEEVRKARSRESGNPYIVYCANCRDVFVSSGKPAVHILELLFGEGEPDLLRRTPTPSEMRENRRKLKADLRKRYPDAVAEELCAAEGTPKLPENAGAVCPDRSGADDTGTFRAVTESGGHRMDLHISEELLEKLGKDRLLTEDVEEVIRFCEKSGRKVWEEETDIFSGHKMIGCATVWVSYRITGDGAYELVNAWWHRMQILEEKGI